MLSTIKVWDPRSEIRDPEKTYSGSRIRGKAPDPGFRIRNTGGFRTLKKCEADSDTHLRCTFGIMRGNQQLLVLRPNPKSLIGG
jgi:hypothetical protein